MNTQQKRKAQQVREEYLRSRVPFAELRPAEIVDVIAGDADGLLPITALNADLKIKIPAWTTSTPPPGRPELLVLEWKLAGDPDYVRLDEAQFTTPISDTFPLSRVIKREYFDGREGEFSFRYGVKSWSDRDLVFATEQAITLDRTPIYGQGDPPAVEDPGLINDDVMAVNGGVLLTIPDFVEDKKEFVKIAVVWAFTPPPADKPITPDFIVTLPANRKVKVDRSIIQKLPSGDHYVAYELFDKAGNRSRPSRLRAVKVALGLLPAQLKAPVVPLAADGLIDLDDAELGVTVEIPGFANHQSADSVVVKWGNETLLGVTIGEGTRPFPVIVPVSWDHLDKEYTNAPDTQTIPVSYDVVRGTTPFPLEPADSITVDVNFAYPGPDNPDDPAQENPILDEVTVKGTSQTENHLIDADQGDPATATFKLYTPVTDGDVITLYWKGVAVADVKILDGSEAPGSDIVFNILWPEISAGQSGNVPVYYTLSHPDHVNDQSSRITNVLVEAVPIVLEKASFPDMSDPGGGLILNCDSLRKKPNGDIGYRVSIPASEHLVAGQDIELRWVLKEVDTPDELPDTALPETVTIPVDADINGMEWFVTPYDPHILRAYTHSVNKWAWAELIYTVTINAKPVTSQPALEIVSAEELGTPDGTCSITFVPDIP